MLSGQTKGNTLTHKINFVFERGLRKTSFSTIFVFATLDMALRFAALAASATAAAALNNGLGRTPQMGCVRSNSPGALTSRQAPQRRARPHQLTFSGRSASSRVRAAQV